jgi:hypothetical protein
MTLHPEGAIDVSSAGIRTYTLPELGPVRFNLHSYHLDEREDYLQVRKTYDRLVALASVPQAADDARVMRSALQKPLDDLLLLASLAARQRTAIFGWTASDARCQVQAFQVHGCTAADQAPVGHANVLVAARDFDEFIRASLGVWRDLDPAERDLLSLAIHRVLPKSDQTLESRILSLFSGLESLVLIHRRKTDRVYTVTDPSAWKRVQSAIRKVILDPGQDFPSMTHREMAIKMLPALRRIPLRDALESFMEHYGVALEDLWPVFSDTSKCPLSKVRNMIAHGESFSQDKHDPLFRAMLNAEVVVERATLRLLGWDVSRSQASPDSLRRLGWVGYQSLDMDQQLLARP